MSLTSDFKVKLQKGMQLFTDLINNISKEQLNTQIHDTEGGWTSFDILRHIAFSEEDIVKLIQNVILGKEGVSKDFNLKRANESNRSKRQSIGLDEVKVAMNRSRGLTLELLSQMNESDWIKKGRYFTGDIMEIKRMMTILVWHHSHHTKQILNKINTS